MRDEALKLALDALINHEGNYKLEKAGAARSHKAITAIQQALAAPVQEPVARVHTFIGGEWAVVQVLGEFNLEDEFYTTPPTAQRQWVGLTEDEQDELVYGVYDLRTRMELAIGIEAKLKEKNS